MKRDTSMTESMNTEEGAETGRKMNLETINTSRAVLTIHQASET